MATQSETDNRAAARSAEYFEKAVNHHAEGRLEAAISAYRAALLGNPDGVDVLGNLGIALCEIGHHEEGIAQMRHALRIAPDDPEILNNLGNALLEEGHSEQALDMLIQAATVSPDDADVRVVLARAYVALGDADQATEQLSAAATIDPDVQDLDEVRAAIASYRLGQTPAAANGAGHSLVDGDNTHAVDAPHYDARNGGSRGDDVAGAVLEPAAPYANGSANGHSAPTEATPSAPAPLPTRPRTGIGFHHPTSVKQLYGSNKIFTWCLIAVVIAHLMVLVYLYLTGQLNTMLPPEIRIHIVKEEKTVVKPLKAPPLGQQTDHPSHNSHPQPHPHQAQTHTVTRAVTTGQADLPSPDMHSPLDAPQNEDELTHNDLNIGGDDTPGSGEIPGFVDGKINGKVYFIRLKDGTGAWDAYGDGTKALLSFATKYFPCESETRPMTAQEIRDNYLSKNMTPSFLYIYADESFELTGSEVTILQNYIAGGGFLFIDGRPDPAVKAAVAAQMDRVLPGSGLLPISGGDPINRFLFRLSSPGIGENFIGVNGVRANYGIRQDRRLVVFFTMGNFSQLYENATPSENEYILAQYQMGANVIAYAIEKGDISKMSPRAGANATVTTSELQQLGFLSGGAPASGLKPGESVKVKGSGSDTDPGEIKGLIDND